MCGCLLCAPYLGTLPATQACALTGNGTSDPLVHRPASIHWATPGRLTLILNETTIPNVQMKSTAKFIALCLNCFPGNIYMTSSSGNLGSILKFPWLNIGWFYQTCPLYRTRNTDRCEEVMFISLMSYTNEQPLCVFCYVFLNKWIFTYSFILYKIWNISHRQVWTLIFTG